MILQARGLTKKFGKTRAVDNLDLELEAGEPIALIGPNGAGKTTFLSLLCGYLLPSAGSVSVLGYRPGSSALHGRIAALPQDAQLNPWMSVERQLRYYAKLQGLGSRDAKLEAARVLELVQLERSAASKPDQLSHGMRKRVSIAQMLLGKPDLALLDEPTAGLDPPNVRIIRDLIAENAADTTFIISSHNLDELERLCSSVVYLTDGQLKEHLPIDHAHSDDGYLTLRLIGVDEDQFLTSATTLSGVLSVSRKPQGDYVIAYNPEHNAELDQALLALLAGNQWKYKHLINGRTLEEKMF